MMMIQIRASEDSAGIATSGVIVSKTAIRCTRMKRNLMRKSKNTILATARIVEGKVTTRGIAGDDEDIFLIIS